MLRHTKAELLFKTLYGTGFMSIHIENYMETYHEAVSPDGIIVLGILA